MKHVIRLTAVLSAVALALSVPVRPALAAPLSDSTTIPRLLDQARHHASEANYDAIVLDSYRLSNLDFRTYAETLRNIQEHANHLFQDYYQLQRLRDGGAPAQQEAIDRLEPLLREMATSLTHTSQMLHEHETQVNMPAFRNEVHSDWVKISAVYEYLCQCSGKPRKI